MAQVEEKESRALKIFLEAIKTYSTQTSYLYWLKRYLRDIGKESYDDLVKRDPKTIQLELENYVMDLKEKNSPSVIKQIFSSLFLFYSMNDIILNQTKLKKLIPSQEERIGGRGYSDEEIKKIFEAIDMNKRKIRTKPRTRALIHTLASTGARVGALQNLRVKDLKPIENCYAVTVYAGTLYEYVTFTTPEATRAINKYLKPIKEKWKDFEGVDRYARKLIVTFQDFYFFNMTTEAMQKVLSRLVRKAQVSHKTDNGRYDIPIAHGFRKRWNTILKSNKEINHALVELMMGHTTSFKQDTHYLYPNVETLFNEYKKAIDTLTIFKEVDTVV